MRLLAPDGRLGSPQRVGDGPDGQAPLVAVSRTGATTLVWSDTTFYARRVSPSGRMGPTRRLRRATTVDESLTVDELGVDRRGVIVAVGTRWTPNTATYPQQDNSHEITAWWRISPRLRLKAPVRTFAPRKEPLGRVDVAVSDSGHAVLGWQRTFYDGAFVRLVAPDGSLGRAHRLADGGLGDVALRPDGSGVVASSGRDGSGLLTEVWATPLRVGGAGRSRRVALSAGDISYLRAGVGGPGRRRAHVGRAGQRPASSASACAPADGGRTGTSRVAGVAHRLDVVALGVADEGAEVGRRGTPATGAARAATLPRPPRPRRATRGRSPRPEHGRRRAPPGWARRPRRC